MDKVNCEIIQDLLALYVDDVCSPSSKESIEIHVESCSNCKDKLNDLQRDEIPSQLREEKDETYKKLATNIRLKKAAFILTCIVIALVILIIGNKIYYRLAWNSEVVISFDKVEVKDISQLSDGRIAFHTLVDDGYLVMGGQFSESDPYPRLSLRRGHLKIKNPDDISQIEKFTMNNTYWIFNANQDKIVYVDDKEYIIWEEGDLIPMASEEMEEKLINRSSGAIPDCFD